MSLRLTCSKKEHHKMYVLKESQDGFLEFQGSFKHFRLLLDLHVTAAKQLFPFRPPFAGCLCLRMLAVEEKEN